MTKILLIISLFFINTTWGYIPPLAPYLNLSLQKNKVIRSFFSKSKVILANDPTKEIMEELWYTDKGIMRSTFSLKGETLSTKITRADRSEIYGKEIKKTTDLIPSLLPGIFLFSNYDFISKQISALGIPLVHDQKSPSANFENIGFGTFLRYSKNIDQPLSAALYFHFQAKTIVGFQRTLNGRTLTFLVTKMTEIESRVLYPSTIEILNEDQKRIGTIKLETALLNVPVPNTIGDSPGPQSTNFWLHDWIR